MTTQNRIKSTKSKEKKSAEDLLDEFHHPDKKVCSIIATCPNKKKNNFASFRPQPGTCLDYQISQTDTKMDAGPVKIHVQETKGTYDPLNPEDILPPPKPKRRKNYWFSGGPPVWEFIDEKWRRKQEALQKGYHQRLAKAEKQSKNSEIKGNRAAHYRLLQLVGPEWYQELSPNQLKTVDNFKTCILKDFKENTIVSTQENLAQLGLVLRPNPKHISFALKRCCKCPVEFLLILYQLANPDRDQYSLNDRLLLSAVVHLTIESTLKELHIRIPSPPRRPKSPKLLQKSKKRLTFESPYLEPYSFEPEPRKFTGIYFDKHLQHPESRYFSYVDNLKEAIRNNKGYSEDEPVDDIDEELLLEVQLAQEIYSNVDFKPVPNLLKPSIYEPCDNFRNKKKELDQPELTEDSNDSTIESVQPSKDLSPLPSIPEKTCAEICDTSESLEEEESLQEATSCCCKPNTTKDLSKSQNNELKNNCSKVSSIPNNEESPCSCAKESIEVFQPLPENLDDSSEINFGEKFKDRDTLPPEKPKGCKINEGECRCKIEAQKTIEAPLCPCRQCEEDRQKKSNRYIISGLKEIDSKTTVPIIEGVIAVEKKCNCFEEYSRKLSEDPCKSEAQKVIAAPLCPCEKCEEERRRRNFDYVISGIKEIDDGTVRVVEGVKCRKPCFCLEEYLSKLELLEDYKKRTVAVNKLKLEEKKFVIGGVVNRPEGPVYMLSGICPQKECKCGEHARKELEEKERLSKMPQIPAGRVKYGISGVKETSEGNVFVLSQALPIEDCDCMKLYNKYETHHSTCMQLYDDYLVQMKNYQNEYLEDWLPNEDKRNSMMSSGGERKSVAKSLTAVGTTEFAITESTPEPLENETCEDSDALNNCGNCESKSSLQKNLPQQEIKNDDVTKKFSKNYQQKCGVTKKKNETKRILTSQCGCNYGNQPKLQQGCNCNREKSSGDTCSCEKISCIDCTCGEEEVEEEETVEIEEVEEEKPMLKRIIILDKFSCNLRKHMKILKQALSVMAEDEYPLAKLPDSYLLPHFKLWLEMRCGRTWTQLQKANYIPESRQLWRHSDRCVRKVEMATLKISQTKAKSLTWFDAKYCRKIVSEAISGYYRKSRQMNIDFGREFFPTTFSYEFPFKTFRDCYFAYTPSKEEEVLAAFVWERFDVKDFSKRKSCFC